MVWHEHQNDLEQSPLLRGDLASVDRPEMDRGILCFRVCWVAKYPFYPMEEDHRTDMYKD